MAANLPPEILLLVFGVLPTEPIYDSWPRWPVSPKDLTSAALVCRSWRLPATAVLYRVIEVKTIRELKLLTAAVLKYPHLKPLIKSLFLPLRFQAVCPPIVVVQYQLLLTLLTDLDEVSYQINENCVTERPVIGESSQRNRNSELRFLGLAGCTTQPFNLPPVYAFFPNLRCLHLTGFKLCERLDPDTTPPLLRLEEITVQVDNCFGLLDDWLCTLPNLRTICVAAMPSQPIAPTKVLQMNRITHLELVVCRTETTYAGTWLGVSNSLRILSITADVFNSSFPEFPMELDHLKIWTVRYIELKMDHFIEYIKSGPMIRTLTIIKDTHADYFVTVESVVQKYCKQGGINLVILSENCGCKDCLQAKEGAIVEKKKASTSGFLHTAASVAGRSMGRRKPRRIMSPEESEIARWEAAETWAVEY